MTSVARQGSWLQAHGSVCFLFFFLWMEGEGGHKDFCFILHHSGIWADTLLQFLSRWSTITELSFTL